MIDSEPKKKSNWITVGKIVFILTVCFLMWRAVDPDAMIVLLSQLSPVMFGFAVVVCILDKIMMGYKWNFLLRLFGIQVPFSVPIVANLRAKVFQYFAPTTLGEDVYKTYYLRQCGAAVAPTVSSILVERIVGIFSSLAVICLLLYIPVKHFSIPNAGLLGVGGFAGFFFVTVIVALMIRYSERLNHISDFKWMPRKIKNHFSQLFTTLALAGSCQRNVWFFYGLSLVEKIAYGSAIYFSAAAINVKGMDFFYILATAPLLALLERLPVTISAIGLREGLIVILMRPYFVDPTVPIMIALVLRAAELIMTFLCLFVWLGRHDGHSYKERIQEINLEVVQIKTAGLKVASL